MSLACYIHETALYKLASVLTTKEDGLRTCSISASTECYIRRPGRMCRPVWVHSAPFLGSVGLEKVINLRVGASWVRLQGRVLVPAWEKQTDCKKNFAKFSCRMSRLGRVFVAGDCDPPVVGTLSFLFPGVQPAALQSCS